MVGHVEVENEPTAHVRVLNEHTGMYVVFYPDRFGQNCWREEFPEAIERLLDTDVLEYGSGDVKDQRGKYPLVSRCASDIHKMNALSPQDRAEHDKQNAMWAFECMVGAVVDRFLHFYGRCPGCGKDWKSCTSAPVICLCGSAVQLKDSGSVSVVENDSVSSPSWDGPPDDRYEQMARVHQRHNLTNDQIL